MPKFKARFCAGKCEQTLENASVVPRHLLGLILEVESKVLSKVLEKEEVSKLRICKKISNLIQTDLKLWDSIAFHFPLALWLRCFLPYLVISGVLENALFSFFQGNWKHDEVLLLLSIWLEKPQSIMTTANVGLKATALLVANAHLLDSVRQTF